MTEALASLMQISTLVSAVTSMPSVTSHAAWAILFPIAYAVRKRELARAEAKAAKLK